MILIPIAVFFGLLIIAMFFADKLIFRPPPASYRDSAQILKLPSNDSAIVAAKYFEHAGAEYTILFSHGNAEDIGTIEPFLWQLQQAGFNVIAYDYQGYGRSTGNPSETNSYSDIAAVYRFLTVEKRLDPNKIILHGRSLGGAVAVDLASRERVGGLILESSFTSAYRVITRYPILPLEKFENLKKIETVEAPLLVIHGTNDWTIPLFHAEQLYDAAKTSKQKLFIEDAGHNDLFYRDETRYLRAVVDFAHSLSPR